MFRNHLITSLHRCLGKVVPVGIPPQTWQHPERPPPVHKLEFRVHPGFTGTWPGSPQIRSREAAQ